MDLNIWDAADAYLLKECYELAERVIRAEEARAILRARAAQIDVPKDYMPPAEGSASPESQMQLISEILEALSLEPADEPARTEFAASHKISNLSNAGAKEYFLTLLTLRSGTNASKRLEALRHLSSALSYSQEDPRYEALAVALQEADE